MVAEYPYYVVVVRSGRLADFCPPQYRHTPIEKQFKSGRIGGTKTTEYKVTDKEEAKRIALRAEGEVDVYTVPRMGAPRERVRDWRSW